VISKSKALKWMMWVHEGSTIFSTCAKRQYMAAILDDHGHILGTGYNGGPRGTTHCADGGCPRMERGSAPGSNYDDCIAIHAEQNALLHSDYAQRAKGAVLIVNGPPCFTCAKLAVNGGIETLVYLTDDSYAQWPEVEAFLDRSGVKLMPFTYDEVAV
jgi:dCMP deaminase